MQVLSETLRTKVEALLSNSVTFADQVEATGHLDQKVLVSGGRWPRTFDHLMVVPWRVLCDRWGVKTYGDFDDHLFTIEMPSGWRLRPLAVDSLWSLIYDTQGRERATVYHQGCLEDYSATVYLSNRFSYFSHYLDPGDPAIRIVAARDERRIFHEFGRVLSADPKYRQTLERIEVDAHCWLDHEFPLWQDPFAYWD